MAERARSRHSHTDILPNVPYKTQSKEDNYGNGNQRNNPQHTRVKQHGISRREARHGAPYLDEFESQEGEFEEYDDGGKDHYLVDDQKETEERPEYRSHRTKHEKRTAASNRTRTIIRASEKRTNSNSKYVADRSGASIQQLNEASVDNRLLSLPEGRGKSGNRHSSRRSKTAVECDGSDRSATATAVRALHDDLEHCHRELTGERSKRERTDRRIAELEEENKVLKHSVEFYKTQYEVIILSCLYTKHNFIVNLGRDFHYFWT